MYTEGVGLGASKGKDVTKLSQGFNYSSMAKDSVSTLWLMSHLLGLIWHVVGKGALRRVVFVVYWLLSVDHVIAFSFSSFRHRFASIREIASAYMSFLIVQFQSV
jgi:hypothetical protein